MQKKKKSERRRETEKRLRICNKSVWLKFNNNIKRSRQQIQSKREREEERKKRAEYDNNMSVGVKKGNVKSTKMIIN